MFRILVPEAFGVLVIRTVGMFRCFVVCQGAINVPQASICQSLHLAPTSVTWSALVAILSPAGLVGAWLAPLAVSRFGIFGWFIFIVLC